LPTIATARSSAPDEFPMTVTGKIQKFVMREAVEARLGLKAAKTA
jgi:fatty-acyl-CoA synthase